MAVDIEKIVEALKTVARGTVGAFRKGRGSYQKRLCKAVLVELARPALPSMQVDWRLAELSFEEAKALEASGDEKAQ